MTLAPDPPASRCSPVFCGQLRGSRRADTEEVRRVRSDVPDAGATEHDQLPAGYHHVRMSTDLGLGAALMIRASEALMTFGVQRGAGLRPVTSAPRAAVGVVVIGRAGLGPLALSIPCRVVWAADEPRGSASATARWPAIPNAGEEAFLLNHDADDVVRFHVRSFSAPARWFTRAAGPMLHVAADAVSRRYSPPCGGWWNSAHAPFTDERVCMIDTTSSLATARQMWTRFEPIHTVTYFTQEARDAYDAVGLRGYWRGYFGRRSSRGAMRAATSAPMVRRPRRRRVDAASTSAPRRDQLRDRTSRSGRRGRACGWPAK